VELFHLIGLVVDQQTPAAGRSVDGEQPRVYVSEQRRADAAASGVLCVKRRLFPALFDGGPKDSTGG
jgi:hypothetical protein